MRLDVSRSLVVKALTFLVTLPPSPVEGFHFASPSHTPMPLACVVSGAVYREWEVITHARGDHLQLHRTLETALELGARTRVKWATTRSRRMFSLVQIVKAISMKGLGLCRVRGKERFAFFLFSILHFWPGRFFFFFFSFFVFRFSFFCCKHGISQRIKKIKINKK